MSSTIGQIQLKKEPMTQKIIKKKIPILKPKKTQEEEIQKCEKNYEI